MTIINLKNDPNSSWVIKSAEDGEFKIHVKEEHEFKYTSVSYTAHWSFTYEYDLERLPDETYQVLWDGRCTLIAKDGKKVT